MPTLHALLVGINAYPNPRLALKGCLNDVRYLHQYLENYCKSLGFEFRPLVRCDSDATRQGVIDGFRHFEAADATDCCLFHFSGHGARSDAPQAFWHLESDKKLESLVCWDSREPGGHDLMDKELSYLIWQASQGKDLPFVSILDCCHSGDMRSAEEIEKDHRLEVVNVRTARDAGAMLSEPKYLGVEHYRKTSTGAMSPPFGRRINLGAARNVEYAKEVNVGGQSRGIFTYSLIEALQRLGPMVTYADLMGAVNLRMRQNVQEQSAQLGATFSEDKNRGFLLSRVDQQRPGYNIAWDKEFSAWRLDAGAVQGIPQGDDGFPTLLELLNDGREIRVESVSVGHSTVLGMDGLDTKVVYPARVKQWAIPKLSLAFAPGSDPDGIKHLTLALRDKDSNLFQIQDAKSANDYLIHARQNAYFMSGTFSDSPLFRRIAGFSDNSAQLFLQDIETVARWQQLLNLGNPATEIRDTEISLGLYRLTEARNVAGLTDDAPMELVNLSIEPALFWYFKKGTETFNPAFQLKIQNTGQRPLWVSMLYLDAQFGIDNVLLAGAELNPGDTVWALDPNNRSPMRTIPLNIDDPHKAEVVEYMKVIISTEELNTDKYYQKGLGLERQAANSRGIFLRQAPKEKDWAARTLALRVARDGS